MLNSSILKIFLLLSLLLFSCSQTNEPDDNKTFELGPIVTDLSSMSLGNSWSAFPKLPDIAGKLHINTVYDMALSNSRIYCATNYEGVYLFDEKQSSWNQVNNGLIKTIGEQPYDVFRTSSIADIVGKVFCASTNLSSDVGIFEYREESNSWIRKISWNITGEVYSLSASKNGYLFAGLSEQSSYSVWLSTDAGNNWKNISGNLKNTSVGHIYSFAFSKDEVFIGTATGIYSTKNLGETWSRVYFPYSEVNTLAIDSQGRFYASSRNKAFRKNDNNSEWTEIFDVPSGRNVNKIFIGANSMLFLACCDGIWRSSDFGKSLTKVGLDNQLPVRLSLNHNGDLIAATKRSGVFISPK